MWLAYRIAPLYLRYHMKVVRIEVAADGLQTLELLRGKRVILTPNHPAQDPAVLFLLSGRLKLKFVWMAAREVFEDPRQGPLVSRVGVFSVDRGRHDEPALRATREAVVDGKHWLVVFPEGISHQLFDEVMPFLPGAARMGLAALDDLARDAESPPPVYLLPVALRYYYLRDMQRTAASSLARLERRLGLPNQGGKKWQERLACISTLMLELNEKHYGVVPEETDSMESRLSRLKEIALRRVAEGLGAPLPDPGQPLRNRVRKLLNLSSQMLEKAPAAGGQYARELDAARRDRIVQLRRELFRISMFMPVRWSYEIDVPTVENFLDTLNLLEKDLLGKERAWGPRGVMLKIGQPVDLREYLDQYRADPVLTGERVMLRLEQEVRQLLKSTTGLMTPLPETLIFS
jgi:1-acyl-sn-glycerol-3-phosphate acyltransferase